MLIHLYYIDVKIGFQSAIYSVGEASNRADVRVRVLAGSLQREVVVSFSTGDSIATGMFC